MAVNMDPAEGRIVVCRARSTAFYPFYEPGGVISRVAGMRVYYKNAEGQEKFTHEYAAVVDTQDEADELIEWARGARLKVQELRASLEAEDEACVARLNKATPKAAKAAPAPKRVARTRSK